MSMLDTNTQVVSGLTSQLGLGSQANETRYTVSIPGVSAELQVLRFYISEQINTPWHLTMTVVSENATLLPASLTNQPMTLSLKGSHGESYYHGRVWQGKRQTQGTRLTQYELICQPDIAWLGLGQDLRIYQQKSVPDIVKTLLQEQKIPADRIEWRLSGKYQARDYCVQYQESNLSFLTRILCEEGLYYFFIHDASASKLVIADHPAAWEPLSDSILYQPGSGQANDVDTLQSLSLNQQVGVQSVLHRQFNYLQPLHLQDQRHALSDTENTASGLAHYRYRSGAAADQITKENANQHLNALQNQGISISGWGNLPQLRTGAFIHVNGHPRKDVNTNWVLTELTLAGEQPQVLEEFSNGQSTIISTLKGIPAERYWKPARYPAKPQLKGLQTAVVTGPSGEEIYTDQYGRIKVQFHWDRDGQRNEHTSCWLRVMHDWAGNGYGIVRLPRIGQEVQVSFENGDPDKPLITGMHHNAEQPTAWQMPTHKTRSGIRTASTPGGVGTNELRFEDKKGHEELRWQAQHDWDVLIQADSHTQIDGNHERIIGGNDYREISGETHIRLEADLKRSVTGDENSTMHGSIEQHLEQKSLIQANQSISWKSDNIAIFHAGTEMTLKAGGSFIKLDPSGVTLSGPVVTLNQGGSAFSAGSEAAQLPTKPAGVHTSGIGKVPTAREPEVMNKIEPKQNYSMRCSE